MCLDTFLIVIRIEFVVFVLFFVLFLGAIDTREYGRRKSVEICFVACARVLGVCIELLAVLKHVFVAPFPRAKRSFGARGALIRFIVAVVALDFVKTRQREHSSSSSGVASHRYHALLPSGDGTRCWRAENRICHAESL